MSQGKQKLYEFLIIGFRLIPYTRVEVYVTRLDVQDGIPLALQVWRPHNGGRRDGDRETPGAGQRRVSRLW